MGRLPYQSSVTARSSRPSPLKSATATLLGLWPALNSRLAMKETVSACFGERTMDAPSRANNCRILTLFPIFGTNDLHAGFTSPSHLSQSSADYTLRIGVVTPIHSP